MNVSEAVLPYSQPGSFKQSLALSGFKIYLIYQQRVTFYIRFDSYINWGNLEEFIDPRISFLANYFLKKASLLQLPSINDSNQLQQ